MKTASGLSPAALHAVRQPVAPAWEAHALRGAELEDSGEEAKWTACEEYEKAWLAGGSQQEIAEKVGKSQRHISYMLRTKVLKDEAEVELSFAEAYSLAKKPPKDTSPKPPPEYIEVPAGLYSTLVIDPPWQYDNRGTRGAANDHYHTMTRDELVALDVPAADEAHLYLWTTNAFLRDAFDLVDAWQFDYKATLVWVKPQMGMGNYFRISHEMVLFGVRGGLKTRRKDALSWFQAPRGKHSAKPDAFYDLVESCSPGPYMDMFNRDGSKLFRRPGWDGWGDEA